MNKVSVAMQPPVQTTVTTIKAQRYDHLQNATQSPNAVGVDSFSTTRKPPTNFKSSSYETTNYLQKGKVVDKKLPKMKGYNKLNQYRLPWHYRILIILLALLLSAAVVLPIILLVFKKTTTTTTSTTTTVTSTNPSATLIVNTSSATSISSTNNTTASATSISSSNNTITITSGVTSVNTTLITTTPAATVTITSNICTMNWTGIQMIAQCVNCFTYAPYHQYMYNYTAISTTSVIAFSMQRQAALFALDDVSVESLAAPGVQLLTNGDFETGNITPWYYCNQNNLANTGGVKTYNFTFNNVSYYPHTGAYYYVGGNTIAADYLSQTFPTVIGQVYNVSLWFWLAVGGPSTSGALFLGV